MKPTSKFHESLRVKQEQASEISKPEQSDNLNRDLVINRIKFILEFAYKRGENTPEGRTKNFNHKTKYYEN